MSEQELNSQVERDPGHDEQDGWLGRLIGALVRLGLVMLLGIALGVGLYLGVPALLQAWTEPVEANTARIEQLEDELARLQSQQQESFDGLSDRVADLEGQSTSQQEAISELVSQANAVEEELESVQEQLDLVDSLSAQLSDLEERVADQQTELEALADAEDEPSSELQALQDQLQRLRAMTLISRGRLELLRSNYGLAQENIESARATFEDRLLAEDSPIISVLERLDLAVQALPDNPSVAADDLEAAWRLLADIDAVETSN